MRLSMMPNTMMLLGNIESQRARPGRRRICSSECPADVYNERRRLCSTLRVPATSETTTTTNLNPIVATDAPGIYKVVTSKTHSTSETLPAGMIYRINTGGPLPVGSDTVIMVEDTRLHSTFKDDKGEDVEEKEVETLAQVPPGENVRDPGSDTRKGDLVLEKGHILHSAGGEIGTLAFVGRTKVWALYDCIH